MIRYSALFAQSSAPRGLFTTYHLEEGENFFAAKPYYHYQEWKRKCAGTELLQTRLWLKAMKKMSAGFYNEGRHPTHGFGPFENELRRRGIEVHKYRLPTTTAVKRIHEMVVLRRLDLEKQSNAAMEENMKSKRQPLPSEWYDETDGPLNPHFLRHVKSHYSGQDITHLSTHPHLQNPKAL